MKKKITILVTGIFMTVAAISGCGSKPTNKTEAPKAEATSESTTTATTTEKKEEVTTESKPTTTTEKSASSEIRPEVKKSDR